MRGCRDEIAGASQFSAEDVRLADRAPIEHQQDALHHIVHVHGVDAQGRKADVRELAGHGRPDLFAHLAMSLPGRVGKVSSSGACYVA